MNRNLCVSWSIIVVLTICLLSCSNNDDKVEPQIEESRYYIKYEVTSTSKEQSPISTGSPGSIYEQTYTFTTERGTESITKKGDKSYSWEATYGPFKKGTKVSLSVSPAKINHAKIYASRDKEPFAIKREEEAKNSEISLSYTIDF